MDSPKVRSPEGELQDVSENLRHMSLLDMEGPSGDFQAGNGAASSVEDYLKVQVQLLREDFFGEVRTELGMGPNGRECPDLTRLSTCHYYGRVHFGGVFACEQGTVDHL